MRPTKYTSRITVQRRTPDPNSIAGWSNIWADLYTTWASVAPVKGYKKLQYASLEYDQLQEVEMRSRTQNPDADCRILIAGTAYQIITTPIEENSRVTFDIGRNME